MDELPEEMVNEILMRVDLSSRLSCSNVSVMWYKLMIKTVKIIVTNDDFRNACRNNDHLSIVKSKFNKDWINVGLQDACRGDHSNLVELMISRGAKDWNLGMSAACREGHLNIVEFMISKGADDWNDGLWNACRGGHLDIVELMISKGADGWNWGLRNACRGGHFDIVELMISRGATNCNCGKSIVDHKYDTNELQM